jgi:hypothetical protein
LPCSQLSPNDSSIPLDSSVEDTVDSPPTTIKRRPPRAKVRVHDQYYFRFPRKSNRSSRIKQQDMPNRCLTPISFHQGFCPEAEMKNDVISINVPNDFYVAPVTIRSKPTKDVRHVDRSGRPQFNATEEKVIEINESRLVYQNFLNDALDDIPLAFWNDARKLLDSYQRAIACKSKPRAILSNSGYFAGELPSKLKPDVIRREKGQYTYNWFLVEYRTSPLSPKKRRVKDRRPHYGAKKAEKNHEYWRTICPESDETDRGYVTSHSVEY